jgi:hypothetical protein
MSVPGSDDQAAGIAVLNARFEMPEAPASVVPVVVTGEDAIASPGAGSHGGKRALAPDARAVVRRAVRRPRPAGMFSGFDGVVNLSEHEMH